MLTQNRHTLLIFTMDYPFGGITEEAFIRPELHHLTRQFKQVFIVPFHNNGVLLPLPESVTVDSSLAETSRSMAVRLRSLVIPELWSMIAKELHRIKSLSQLRAILAHWAYARHVYYWYKTHYAHREDITTYTFWFDFQTLGLSMAKRDFSLRSFSRAHRYDIYDNQVLFRSHALRRYALNHIDHLFPCSKQGTTYLQTHYPDFSNKITTAYLGSENNHPLCDFHSDTGQLTFITCARAAKVKRIHLIPQLLSAVADRFPNMQIHWIYIGNGPTFDKIQQSIEYHHRPNLTVDCRGALPNHEVHRIYATEHLDWHILVSSSEGLPICLAESISYGIPIIATNVGGVSEIVTPETGILLDANPTAEELLSKLEPYIHSPKKQIALHQSAYHRWQTSFNAELLRRDFAERISPRP